MCLLVHICACVTHIFIFLTKLGPNEKYSDQTEHDIAVL